MKIDNDLIDIYVYFQGLESKNFDIPLKERRSEIRLVCAALHNVKTLGKLQFNVYIRYTGTNS